MYLNILPTPLLFLNMFKTFLLIKSLYKIFLVWWRIKVIGSGCFIGVEKAYDLYDCSAQQEAVSIKTCLVTFKDIVLLKYFPLKLVHFFFLSLIQSPIWICGAIELFSELLAAMSHVFFKDPNMNENKVLFEKFTHKCWVSMFSRLQVIQKKKHQRI